jgi:microcystin-dependent protein
MTQLVPAALIDPAVFSAIIPSGVIVPFAGTVAPSLWLLCDGTAYSRSTYASLYTAIGTLYGVGDGSSTFNVPDLRGRVPVGAGQGQAVETVTNQTASSNAIPVASNTWKWVTGMQVTVTNATGFTGLTNGTYYIVRASSSSVQFASSLANAQNGTPVVTITGTGSCTITWTGSTRAAGEVGGEEAHAMSITELLSHTHGIGATNTTGYTAGGQGSPQANTSILSSATGGNSAMNNMQPFLGTTYIIKT